METNRDALIALAGQLMEKVKEEMVQVSISMTEDMIELTVSPYEPYKPVCPYGKENNNG